MTPDPVRPLPALEPEERRRYGRHLALPEVGEDGQRRIKAGRVLLVGVGGLGSPAALYLAAAGVGTLGIADFDTVDASNLQRQVAHGTAAIGRPKVDSVRERLADLNPFVNVVTHQVRLDRTNALAIIHDYDVVVDGSDDFATRYLVNDACVLAGKPNVYGSILRFEGQASVFDARVGPCYRCLYPSPPPPGVVPSCAEAGVLGVLPGVIGCLQATEALKLLLGGGESLVGRLLVYDAWEMRFRELRLRKDPNCPICGEHPSIHELIDHDVMCGSASPLATPANATGGTGFPEALSVKAYAELRAAGAAHQLVDVREPEELAIARIDGALHVPMALVPLSLERIDRAQPVVLLCHRGSRSLMVMRYLQQQGYTQLSNLVGGIDAWSREVDPALPRY